MNHSAIRRHAVLLMAVVVLLAGCAHVTTPRTPDQTVYATYGLYQTVGSTAADLLNARAITVGQAEYVQATLTDVRPMLNSARDMVDGGAQVPDTTLDIVLAIQQRLLQLQNQLEANAP